METKNDTVLKLMDLIEQYTCDTWLAGGETNQVRMILKYKGNHYMLALHTEPWWHECFCPVIYKIAYDHGLFPTMSDMQLVNEILVYSARADDHVMTDEEVKEWIRDKELQDAWDAENDNEEEEAPVDPKQTRWVI